MVKTTKCDVQKSETSLLSREPRYLSLKNFLNICLDPLSGKLQQEIYGGQNNKMWCPKIWNESPLYLDSLSNISPPPPPPPNLGNWKYPPHPPLGLINTAFMVLVFIWQYSQTPLKQTSLRPSIAVCWQVSAYGRCPLTGGVRWRRFDSTCNSILWLERDSNLEPTHPQH